MKIFFVSKLCVNFLAAKRGHFTLTSCWQPPFPALSLACVIEPVISEKVRNDYCFLAQLT